MVMGLVTFLSLVLVGSLFALGVFDQPNINSNNLFGIGENCKFGGVFNCREFGVYNSCLVLNLENTAERSLIIERINISSDVLKNNCNFVLGQTSSDDGYLRSGETRRFILNSNDESCDFIKSKSKQLNSYDVHINYSWSSNRGDKGFIKGVIVSKSPITDNNLCNSGLNGVCGSSLYTCKIGSFVNTTTNPNTPIWQCNGYKKGSNTICKPIKGICNNKNKDSCKSGEARPIIKDNTTHYLWYCKGLNGGDDSNECYSLKINAEILPSSNSIPISGECGPTRNTCADGKGDPLARNSNETHYRWYCRGLFEGQDAECNICRPQLGGWSKWSECKAYQTRTCDNPTPTCGGTCPNGKLTETQSCTMGCNPQRADWKRHSSGCGSCQGDLIDKLCKVKGYKGARIHGCIYWRLYGGGCDGYVGGVSYRCYSPGYIDGEFYLSKEKVQECFY